MESIKHIQSARRKLINIQTCKKYAPEYKRDKTSSIEVHLKLEGKLRWPLMLKNKADSLTFLSLMAWFVSSACDFYLFPVTLSHPRWLISKMALVGPSLLTVKVKSSDPRDSANDQKSLPQADLLCQSPRLCPASPSAPPSGLTLLGA